MNLLLNLSAFAGYLNKASTKVLEKSSVDLMPASMKFKNKVSWKVISKTKQNNKILWKKILAYIKQYSTIFYEN